MLPTMLVKIGLIPINLKVYMEENKYVVYDPEDELWMVISEDNLDNVLSGISPTSFDDVLVYQLGKEVKVKRKLSFIKEVV